MPRLTSKHYNGTLGPKDNRAAAQRAQIRKRAFMARYRIAMLARKQAIDALRAARLQRQDQATTRGFAYDKLRC